MNLGKIVLSKSCDVKHVAFDTAGNATDIYVVPCLGVLEIEGLLTWTKMYNEFSYRRYDIDAACWAFHRNKLCVSFNKRNTITAVIASRNEKFDLWSF